MLVSDNLYAIPARDRGRPRKVMPNAVETVSKLVASDLPSLKGVQFPFVRIDNYPPLETQAQERESNPEPGFPQAAGLMDCWTACLHFSGVKLPQADTEDDGPPSETD
ncbi:hypothetical protein DSO57_1022279 [Entomophthora muscae]|uniref:Uncharacterized protein n=1 Tax=Entomophthora muscae TaxID=34485 RepID=A0ACC2S520_9FUNG|nr:hypothetical protein DSO57_1022279 [Entomophthora muscae]